MSLVSTATITVIGLTCKAFLNLGLVSCSVNGLSTLLHALTSKSRDHGQGVLTVANHISTLDDPVMWGVLPASHYLQSGTMRWALGASDVMFTNPVFSAFFRNGQVLETFRGKGVFQPAIDSAIEKLNQGHWIHVFPESKIKQSHTYTVTHGLAHLPRFKWGIGRMLMETKVPPVVIPMWLQGFDRLMPEGRPFPSNYLPRLGVDLGITIGDPIPHEKFQSILTEWRTHQSARTDGVLNADQGIADPAAMLELEEMKTRSALTAVAQDAVEELGRSVSGPLLGASK